ncbi:hypothetical protein NUW54_g2031 [Trametes sanguinea]|uniref:Uncharacterized protein n=1 Tax=Trametes sanguinea TaxID=158606 RepID=A0ACC1Q5A7_9APHY|nr:hypothetical protein NUW54_g2031 [Trametes sanguinea]
MFVRLLFTALVTGGFLLATALGDSAPGRMLTQQSATVYSEDVQLKCACQDAPLLTAIAMCVVSNCPEQGQAVEAMFEQECGASVSTALNLPSGGPATMTSTTVPPGGPTITDSSLSSTGSGTSSKHADSISTSASGTSTRSEHANVFLDIPFHDDHADHTAVSSAADNSTSLSSMAPSGTIASQSPPAKTSNAAPGDVLVKGVHSVLFAIMGASMVALGVVY